MAQNGLIDPKDWKDFENNLSTKNNDIAIKAFAKKVKIHPCIVRGRICYTLNDYRTFSQISHDIN